MNPIHQQILNDKIEKSGMPAKWWGKFAEDVIVQPTFITGPVGCGKTHYMAAMMHEQWRSTLAEKLKWQTIVWTGAPALLFRLRASYGPGATETERQIIREYTAVDWLYLDDLGADKPSDWVRSSLYLIIDTLYQSGKNLVVSSNLSLSELAEIYDDRLTSRIMEMCQVKTMTGVDKRGKK